MFRLESHQSHIPISIAVTLKLVVYWSSLKGLLPAQFFVEPYSDLYDYKF
jgi:hypothetical protein